MTIPIHIRWPVEPVPRATVLCGDRAKNNYLTTVGYLASVRRSMDEPSVHVCAGCSEAADRIGWRTLWNGSDPGTRRPTGPIAAWSAS